MAKPQSIISPEEGAGLQRLQAEYLVAAKRAAAALRIDGEPLKGPALQHFLEEEEKVAVIVRRIKQIIGTTGDIVPCHSHRVIEVDIDSFILRISALNPSCHCCLPNQFESDMSARECRVEFLAHTATAPREILQRFERDARVVVLC